MRHGNVGFLFFDFSLFLNNAMLFIPVHLYLTLLVSYTHTKTHWKLLGDGFECTSAPVSKPHLHLCHIYSDQKHTGRIRSSRFECCIPVNFPLKSRELLQDLIHIVFNEHSLSTHSPPHHFDHHFGIFLYYD